VALGLGGVAFLVAPKIAGALRSPEGLHGAQAIGMGALVVSSLSWATGSLYSRGTPRAGSAIAGTGMQLMCGGGLLLLASGAAGEPARLSGVSWLAAGSLVYLILFGSVLGYSSYIWLLRVTRPAVVSSYAFVNPVVAVVLGAAIGGEALTGRVLASAAVIVCGVVVVVCGGRGR
jgi:drug/metabolite transporter (DMT)-like permease